MDFCVLNHKTAYEVRISVWSLDVCSSELEGGWVCSRLWSSSRLQGSGGGSLRTDCGSLVPSTITWRVSTGRGPQAPLVVAPSKGDPDPGAVPSRGGRPRAGRGRVVRKGGRGGPETGGASWRERGCSAVSISVVSVAIKKKKK